MIAAPRGYDPAPHHATAFLSFALGIKGSDERANAFRPGDDRGSFAGPCTAVLEAGADARYPMLTVLGGLAEFERDFIRGRTSEGRDRAKVRDVKLGRKAETDRTPEVRDDPAARLSTARRCETFPAAKTCRTARFAD